MTRLPMQGRVVVSPHVDDAVREGYARCLTRTRGDLVVRSGGRIAWWLLGLLCGLSAVAVATWR